VEGWVDLGMHCSEGVRPVPKTVCCSGCCDKQNRPQWESNLGTVTAQSDALTTRPLRPYNPKKVARTRLPSVGFRSWSRLLAVSLQVTWVINPVVAAITIRQACSYPRNPKEGCYQFRCLVNRGRMGVNSLPKTVTWQRRGCDLNPGPTAPESSTLATWLPSHSSGWSVIMSGNKAGKQKRFQTLTRRSRGHIVCPAVGCIWWVLRHPLITLMRH